MKKRHIITFFLLMTALALSARREQYLADNWQVHFLKTSEDSITENKGTFTVSIPNNLDDYYGYRQLKHGNLHGSAVYERHFTYSKHAGKRYLLQFEGVGTYATVTLNTRKFPTELVGRTCYTIDITDCLLSGDNTLSVLVDHPAYQTACPWVCGGCSAEWGFSEGSQPFGIFRPVKIIETPEVAIEPFGVHIWSNAACDSVFINTEVSNHGTVRTTFTLDNTMYGQQGEMFISMKTSVTLNPGETKTVHQEKALNDALKWGDVTASPSPTLWSVTNPYLYILHTRARHDEVTTEFGFRNISWPLHRNDGTGTFKLNGENVLINGTCDYEHIFGASHSFTRQQIEARMKMMRQAGFNAFREAHQPHNLYYQQLLDEQGMLFWSQFSAHIWYDTPAFREAFKNKLRQWIRERRNSPSIILWGLQNESVLPEDFARECSDIIRDMDPTCADQRAITTCNGGTGTDWNVIQNWSGTYGGNMHNYDKELKSATQLLNGEYGAWRTLGLHGSHKYSEESALNILSTKAMLAESARDSVCGHFQWPFVSHDNPGRIQPDESVRLIDKVGPFNYKGLLTPWEEPTSLYWWYHSRYADNDHYAARHDATACGRKCPAKACANDKDKCNTSSATPTREYLYRVNCGGDRYTDTEGNVWAQDNASYSHSWAEDFPSLNQFTASQGHINADIIGTDDDTLYQYFRWGRHKLYYEFPVTDGKYHVELFFAEPWIGAKDDKGLEYSALRLFDVGINDTVVFHDIDLWNEGGYARAVKKETDVDVVGGKLRIHFPDTKVGEAVISAIAISRDPNPTGRQADSGSGNASAASLPEDYWTALDSDTLATFPKDKLPQTVDLPSTKYEQASPGNWTITPGIGKEYMLRFRYKNTTGEAIRANMKIIDSKNIVMQDGPLTLPPTPDKFKIVSTATSSQINAGTYRVILTDFGAAAFDTLEVQ